MTVAQFDVSLDRLVPQSLDAERAVLGSILINNQVFYRIIGMIDTDDFFKNAHRTIFAAMRRMTEQRHPIDPLTLKEELAEYDRLHEVGGVAYISALLDMVPETANVERCIEIVKEKATLRRLFIMQTSAMRVLETAREPSLPRRR